MKLFGSNHLYSAHIEDNVLCGRGASDIKAGLVAALVIAFISLQKK